jgi:hypothetical protein
VDQIVALGYCFSVKVLIEYRCNINSPYETAFIGYINIKNAEIDQEKKVVIANIEPDDVYAAFLSMSDTEYNLYTTSMLFPNGNSITLPTTQKFYHFIEDGSFYVGLDSTKKANYFHVFDVLNYLVLNYLVQANTQGRLSVVSDFFTTEFTQINKWDVTLAGTTLAAGTINVTYKDQFGQFKTVSQAFSVSESNTLDLLAKQLIEETSSIVDIANINTKGLVRNYFTHLSWPAYSRSARKISLESWLPYQITSVTITAGTVGSTITATETQAYQNGAGNLWITNQEQEAFFLSVPNIGDNRPISFDKLFKELDALYYLGMKLERNGDDFVLRIEPMDYFFSQNNLMRLEGVMNVQTKFNSGGNYNAISVGSSGDYVTHKYSGGQAGTIEGTSGNFFVEFTGPNPTTYIWRYIAVRKTSGLEVKQIISVTPGTGVKWNFGTRTANDVTFAPYDMILCDFTINQASESLLNSDTICPIAPCYGEQLRLKNDFCIDLEYHGDQVSADYDFKLMNGSAAPNTDKWTMVLLDPADLDQTLVYKAMLINDGIEYTRYQFNGHLTNHHKIRNNFSRIKETCFYQPKEYTEGAGTLLPYENTSEIIPKRIHEFTYPLSHNQMLSLIQNPEVMIEIDPTGSGEYVSCWIQEIEMNINTKQANLKLYEN